MDAIVYLADPTYGPTAFRDLLKEAEEKVETHLTDAVLEESGINKQEFKQRVLAGLYETVAAIVTSTMQTSCLTLKNMLVDEEKMKKVIDAVVAQKEREREEKKGE